MIEAYASLSCHVSSVTRQLSFALSLPSHFLSPFVSSRVSESTTRPQSSIFTSSYFPQPIYYAFLPAASPFSSVFSPFCFLFFFQSFLYPLSLSTIFCRTENLHWWLLPCKLINTFFRMRKFVTGLADFWLLNAWFLDLLTGAIM